MRPESSRKEKNETLEIADRNTNEAQNKFASRLKDVNNEKDGLKRSSTSVLEEAPPMVEPTSSTDTCDPKLKAREIEFDPSLLVVPQVSSDSFSDFLSEFAKKRDNKTCVQEERFDR
ncbi:hypothetical protein RCL_jg304.t1 [Rhizophagus clarus]|uniref:Uncharacterized protein n=1 Tax=Rhizophagus clarus TaxID=94130 RepID=A0A8H3LVY1_9GLOM|nr:hypothetical protein RCL_jg304.t1 [Rhizophagus clarus]